MKNRNYWPLLFIGIFSFTLGMIIWTIMSAVKVPVHEDKSFLSSYQKVDEKFNDIVASNEVFKSKYEITFNLNGNNFGLDIKDIFLAQRVIEEKPTHKDYLRFGKNSLTVDIKDMNGNSVDALINFKVTKATNNYSDTDISNNETKSKEFNFDVIAVGNWNVTGTVEVANDKGYFFIKTNAIK